jgi:hypothetical protein
MDGSSGPRTLPGNDSTGLVLFLLCLLLVSLSAAGCSGTVPAKPEPALVPSPVLPNHTVSGVDLVFFHPVPGCDSCDQVGRYANDTVHTYFAPELASGRISYRDVNLNLPENRDIANRYGAYDNSLWIGVQDERGFHSTEIIDIWYYAYNREEFMTYLRGVIGRALAGTG